MIKNITDWFRVTSLLGNTKLAERLSVTAKRRPRTSTQVDAIRFAGQWLPVGSEKLHFAFVGTTGSGKSTLIQLVMQQALAMVGQGLGRRALIYDAKRDLISHLSRMCPHVPICLLNPFDRRGVAWQLSEDVTDPSTAFQIASIFIPVNEQLAQPFFEDTSRAVIKGVMLSFMNLTRKYGTKWDLRDVILGCSTRHVRRVLKLSDQNLDVIDSLIRGREDTAKDVFATLSTKLDPFRSVAGLWANAKQSISLRKWAQSESVLVLGSNPAKSEAINTINRIIFSRVADLLSDFPDNRDHQSDPRRSWIFIDELAQLQRLPKLREMFSFGRSKGVCVCVGFQDIEGLYPIYGKDTTHSLLGNVGHKAILRLDSDVTAAWASALLERSTCSLRRAASRRTIP